MVTHPLQPIALEPQPDESKPDPERLRLESPRAELFATDQGLKIANAIWFLCYPGLPADFQVRRS